VRRRLRPLPIAAASGFVLFAALAAIAIGGSHERSEPPAQPDTLQEIARKNDAAAMRAAAAMEARSEAQANASRNGGGS
jgi:hypothetical protein